MWNFGRPGRKLDLGWSSGVDELDYGVADLVGGVADLVGGAPAGEAQVAGGV